MNFLQSLLTRASHIILVINQEKGCLIREASPGGGPTSGPPLPPARPPPPPPPERTGLSEAGASLCRRGRPRRAMYVHVPGGTQRCREAKARVLAGSAPW